MKEPNLKKIMVFGTFDILHKGHLHFFKQARKFGLKSFLVVSVARDINVKKIKGTMPEFSERTRLGRVSECKLVNQATLGGKKDFLSHILKIRPNIIALGYDQVAYTQNLKNILKSKGLEVIVKRLKSYKPNKYKSSILKKSMQSNLAIYKKT